MDLGIHVSGGCDTYERVDTQLLASLGLRALFVSCFEDEIRWRAEDAAALFRRARHDGLEPYAVPWGYGKCMDPDPSIESLYVQTHPECCQIDSRGRRLARACPNNPRFLEWFSSSMRTLAWLMECRGFLWDEPGFHHARGAWSCRCTYCSRLFRASYDHEMPRELTDEVLEFRRRSVTMLVLAATAAVQAVDRRLRSLVMPSPRMGRVRWFPGTEDVAQLARCAGVDGLCALVPWQEMGASMEFGIRQALEEVARPAHAEGKGCALWLNASPRVADRTLDALECALRHGADAVVLSDYSSLIDSPGFPFMRPRLQETLQRCQEAWPQETRDVGPPRPASSQVNHTG